MITRRMRKMKNPQGMENEEWTIEKTYYRNKDRSILKIVYDDGTIVYYRLFEERFPKK